MSYSYTAQQTEPTVGNLFVYTLPQDNVDPASAPTFTTPFSNSVDELAFTYRALSGYRPHVTLWSLTSNSVRLAVLQYTFVQGDGLTPTRYLPSTKQSQTDLTAANIEGGGGFFANSWYYIYLKSSDLSPNIVLSTSGPEQSCTYRAGLPNYRYLGSFWVDGAGNIPPFSMCDFNYTFGVPRNTNFSITSYNSTTVAATVTFGFMTPTARTVKTLSSVVFGGAGGPSYYGLSGSPVTQYTTSTWGGYILNATGGVEVERYFAIDIPFTGNATQQAAIKFTSPGGAAIGTTSALVYWTGYIE